MLLIIVYRSEKQIVLYSIRLYLCTVLRLVSQILREKQRDRHLQRKTEGRKETERERNKKTDWR